MKTNEGYKILKEENYSSRRGIAMGYNAEAKIAKYVTWEYKSSSNGITDFYWGHYFDEPQLAIQDYHKRLAERYNDIPF